MIAILNLLKNTQHLSSQLSRQYKKLPKELREGINITITTDIPQNINSIIKRINKDNGYEVYPEINTIEEAIQVLDDNNKFEEHCKKLTPASLEIVNNEKDKLTEQESILTLCLNAMKLPDL